MMILIHMKNIVNNGKVRTIFYVYNGEKETK